MTKKWVDEFLDLWQEQLAEVMRDPRIMLEILRPYNSGVSMSWPPDLSAFFTEHYGGMDGSTESDSSLSALSDDERSDIASRLSEYEKRIAELEREIAKKGD